MPNITSVLNEQIRRLARREVTADTRSTRKATAQYRRDIAALKRAVKSLTSRLATIEKHQPQELTAAPEVVDKARFRADGLKTHRGKLGISAKDYGKLAGVSSLTIYNWESGKSRPRKAALARYLAIRGLGKREAMERLGLAQSATATPVAAPVAGQGKKTRQRGRFGQTATAFILGLLKAKRTLTSTEINKAWEKAGRPRNADNTLSLMVKGGMLARTKRLGERGSNYRAR
jgi:DNA-binding transcriptional regulator YiaG